METTGYMEKCGVTKKPREINIKLLYGFEIPLIVSTLEDTGLLIVCI